MFQAFRFCDSDRGNTKSEYSKVALRMLYTVSFISRLATQDLTRDRTSDIAHEWGDKTNPTAARTLEIALEWGGKTTPQQQGSSTPVNQLFVSEHSLDISRRM